MMKLANIEAAKQIYERLDGWKLANEVISSYLQDHPGNTKEQSVVVKVVLVNSLYFAGIREPLRMVRHILELHGLDQNWRWGK
jgi:hypothetical protein